MSSKRKNNKIQKTAWGGVLEPATAKKNTNGPARLKSIDMMVGMAMLFVVLGHMTIGDEPLWYTHGLRNWIYSFHMQMFVFLSSFLIRHTYKEVHSAHGYFNYIWRKFKKFFIWYLIIGLIVAFIPYPNGNGIISQYNLFDTLRDLLLYPRHSKASFLWYIYILFGFYIVSPLFFKLPQWIRTVCCTASMFLPMAQATNFMAAYDFCQYTFFYCLGVLCAEWTTEIRGAKTWLWALLSVPFILFTSWVFSEGMSIGFDFRQLDWWLLVTGVAALPFFYLLALALQKSAVIARVLELISNDCYWIYLLQMFVIWGVVSLLRGSGFFPVPPFGLIMTIASLLAVALPVALDELFKKTMKKRGTLHEHPAKNTSLK